MIGGYRAFAAEIARSTVGYDGDDYQGLADLEGGSFWFLARNALISWAAQTYFGSTRYIHEFGCGTGFVLEALRRTFPSARLSGSEVLVQGLAFAAERVPDAELYQVDATRIPFSSEFDLVGAFDVLEHIADDRAALGQMFQALVPGGGLLITVPQHPALWSRQDELAHHERRYLARDLIAKVRGAGFKVLRTTSFVSILLPAMLAARRFAELRGDRDGVRAVAQPALVGRALGAIMDLERMSIRRGASLPIGGSRLVVARRPY